MNLEFFLPANKNKSLSKKKVSIPANIIENILTNRQNRNMIEENSNQHIDDNSNTNQNLNQEDKYVMIISENQRLKEENKKLRDMIELIKNKKEKEKNDNKQSLANLLLSLSNEKQEDNNFCYRNNSNEINLIDDSDFNNINTYCNTEGDIYSNHNNTHRNNNSQKTYELTNIINRTKSILNKYQSTFFQNNKINGKLN